MNTQTITLEEAAKILGVHYGVVHRAVHIGYIKAMQNPVSLQWCIPVSWFENLKAYICDSYGVNIRNKTKIRKHLEDITSQKRCP